jgi:copper(I)-binding protein
MIHTLLQYRYPGSWFWAAFLGSAAMVLAALAAPSRAHDLRHGDIHIGHVWARPAAAGATAEVYFAVINRGADGDRLVGARSSLAARVTLAETRGEGAATVPSIELAPSRPVALRPGRLHVRLEGLTRAVRAGDRFGVTLLFAQAPPAEVTAIVETGPGH